MAENKEKPSDARIVDPCNVSEVFVTDVALVHYENSTVTLTFSTSRAVQESGSAPIETVKVVSARLSMPLATVVNLHANLARVIEMHRKTQPEVPSTPTPSPSSVSKPN